MDQLNWRKSTKSGSNGENCVEVAPARTEIAVRDSKNPDGPRHAFTRRTFRSFASAVKSGQYDR
ncbi:hypothetical protein GCM10027589_12140 [Actinocorallia lasiicapitis]